MHGGDGACKEGGTSSELYCVLRSVVVEQALPGPISSDDLDGRARTASTTEADGNSSSSSSQQFQACRRSVSHERRFELRPDAEKKKSVLWLDPPLNQTLVSPSGVVAGEVDDADAQTATAAGAMIETIGSSTTPPPCHVIKLPPMGNEDSIPTSTACYECALQPDFNSNATHEISAAPPFHIGGFQLVSNAPHVRVYLTPVSAAGPPTTCSNEGSDESGALANEVYLTTVRGLRVPATSPDSAFDYDRTASTRSTMYKSQCVVPGGPRPVRAVRLVFDLSSKNAPPTSVGVGSDGVTLPDLHVQFIRWTVRLAAASGVAATVAAPAILPLSMASAGGAAAQMNRGDFGGVNDQTSTMLPRTWNHAPSIGQPTPTSGVHDDKGQNQHNRQSAQPASSTNSAELAGLAFAVHHSQQQVTQQVVTSQRALQAQLLAAQQQIAALSAQVMQLTVVVQKQQETMTAQYTNLTRLLEQEQQQHPTVSLATMPISSIDAQDSVATSHCEESPCTCEVVNEDSDDGNLEIQHVIDSDANDDETATSQTVGSSSAVLSIATPPSSLEY